jgi:hypothetical protein
MWFFRIVCTSLDKDYLFLYFLDVLRFFLGIDVVRRQLRLTIWSLERIHHFLCTCYVLVIYNDREPTVCLFHTLDFRVFMCGCEKTLLCEEKNILWVNMSCQLNRVDIVSCELWVYELVIFMNLLYCELVIFVNFLYYKFVILVNLLYCEFVILWICYIMNCELVVFMSFCQFCFIVKFDMFIDYILDLDRYRCIFHTELSFPMFPK